MGEMLGVANETVNSATVEATTISITPTTAPETTEIDGADHFAVPALTYLNNDYHVIDWLIGKLEQ